MSTSVNLVPQTRLVRLARGRHARRWAWVCGLWALVVATAWAAQFAADRALTGLAQGTRDIDARRAEIETRLTDAVARRAALFDQVQSASQARRPQPWPRRLVALAEAASDGVFLTHVAIATPESNTRTVTLTPAAEDQSVRLIGYARDHAVLLRFLNTVEALPAWEHVELVRATQEPFGSTSAVAFELDCRTSGGAS
jgi:hypothetical protein